MDDEYLAVNNFIEEIKKEAERVSHPFGVRELLFCMRDIPYGRPQNSNQAMSVLSEWTGTCSGKHLLAKSALAVLGYQSQLYCIPYCIDDAFQFLPSAVIERFAGKNIWDVHNVLMVEMPSIKILVDVTWPRELKAHGFLTTTEWDGETDFSVAAPSGDLVQIAPDENLVEVKQDMLNRLNDSDSTIYRERYIAELADFARNQCNYLARELCIQSTLQDIYNRS